MSVKFSLFFFSHLQLQIYLWFPIEFNSMLMKLPQSNHLSNPTHPPQNKYHVITDTKYMQMNGHKKLFSVYSEKYCIIQQCGSHTDSHHPTTLTSIPYPSPFIFHHIKPNGTFGVNFLFFSQNFTVFGYYFQLSAHTHIGNDQSL